jgi:hypothetical protein
MVSELHHTSTEPTCADMAIELKPNPFNVYLSPTKTKPDLLFSQTELNRTLGCVRFLDGVEWNGTIPFHCHGTVPSLCSVWTKNYHGTVPSLCSVLEWDENGME